jgi:G3E family GTPase
VLIDADRDPSRFPATLTYLYQKQQAEAEILALNKADLLSESEQQARLDALRANQPNAQVMALSARTGAGLDEWLNSVLNETSRLAHVLEIDYQTYAEAEAGLGWLNLKASVRAGQPFSAADWLTRLLQNVEQQLAAQQADIAHVKAHFAAPTVHLKASLTESGKPPFWDMWSPHSETDRGQLLLNARVQCDPPTLERAVRDALNMLQPITGSRVDVVHLECFSPAPPQPTHRLSVSVN